MFKTNKTKTLIRYAQRQNIRKPNNLKAFGSQKIKGPKQDSKHRLSSPMYEREYLTLNNNYTF